MSQSVKLYLKNAGSPPEGRRGFISCPFQPVAARPCPLFALRCITAKSMAKSGLSMSYLIFQLLSRPPMPCVRA